MRPIFVVLISVWSCATANAQIIFNNHWRTLDARAIGPSGDWTFARDGVAGVDLWNRPRFTSRVEVAPIYPPGLIGATAAAWQDSWISDTEIVARGGVEGFAWPRDSETGWAESRAITEITFTLTRPETLILDVFYSREPSQQPGDPRGAIDLGDLEFSLMAINDGPHELLLHHHSTYPPTPGDIRFRLAPIHETVQLRESQRYRLAVNAYNESAGMARPFPLSYDVQLRITQVPEPATYLLAALALVGLLWLRRHRLNSTRAIR